MKEAADHARQRNSSVKSLKGASAEGESLTQSTDERRTLESFLTLKDLGIVIRQGEFVCIIGDVGSGKSSLLNAVIGDLLFTSPQFFGNHAHDKLDDHLIDAMIYHAQQGIPK